MWEQLTVRKEANDDGTRATQQKTEHVRKTKVNQHKMVYDALDGKMGGILHALSLTTLTPKK